MIALTPVLPIAGLAWLLAQCLKYLGDPQAKFTDPGGMPSSHAAVVGAATVAVGYEAGLDSPVFGLAVIFAAIVLHDAFRLRWAVGQQAIRLNELLAKAKLRDEAVVVWKGHRLREVAVGLALGVAVAVILELTVFA